MQLKFANATEISAIKSDGTVIAFSTNQGCTLANSTTYYFPVGDQLSTQKSVHLKWDTALVGVLTLWGSTFPRDIGDTGTGAADVTDYSQTSGEWVQINPPLAVLYNVSDNASTGGATIVAATVTLAGGTAGGVIYDLTNIPVRRLRIRAAITTGGKLRCATWAR